MIGIVILNYINWEVTEKCLYSIIDTMVNINYHIFLVDNASPNQPTKDFLRLIKDENITFIKNTKNSGYAAGNNIGITRALKDNCEAILIANSDIIFLENSIISLYNYLQENSNVGIVGPKILNVDGGVEQPSMCIRTGLKEKYLVNTFLRHIFKSRSNKYFAKGNDLSKPFSVQAVLGGCFLMSRKCALDITPLDENTFLFEEELIIGIRMEQKGYKTIYYPQSTVIHAHGQSTKSVRAFSYICFVESEIYYCKRYLNVSKVSIWPLYLIRSISYLGRCLKYKDFRKNILIYFKKTWTRLIYSIER